MQSCTVHLKLRDGSTVDIDVDCNSWDDETGSGMELEGRKIIDWNDANRQPIGWTDEIESKLMNEIEDDEEYDAEFWRQVGQDDYEHSFDHD